MIGKRKMRKESPALSAMAVGSCLRALAKASMAKACFPCVLGTSMSIWFAMYISVAPPPGMVLVSFTVWEITQRASWRDLSASSSKWELAPLKMMEQAWPLYYSTTNFK